MFTGTGRCASDGVCAGPIVELKETIQTPIFDRVFDESKELSLFDSALQRADKELEELYEKTLNNLGQESADIIDMQRMMLQDPDISQAMIDKIKQGVFAKDAIIEVGKQQAAEFAALDDPYMQARSADIKDITLRLYRLASGQDKVVLIKPCVLVSNDLIPSQTLDLDKSMILGILLRQGTMNSHASILARTMDIPLLINANVPNEDLNDRVCVIDAHNNKFYLDADDSTIAKVVTSSSYLQEKEHLASFKGKESITKHGRKIKVCANIGSPDDVEGALLNDAEGIGLFRSEFLFLGKTTYPSADEQFAAYASVVRAMNGKEVIIRTLDIGADKKVDYFELPQEQNPALGFRALRICLKREDLFKTQIKAIYRAAAFGNVLMMFPMVTSLWEVQKAKKICKECEKELLEANIDFKVPKIGIMIETPAAAICSDKLAKEVDFFSVGTNDLTQYTLAIDRQNENLDDFYDEHHEAILELLALIAKNAHKNGIWAGICGQLAADLSLTDTFIQMGYDELSVPANTVLKLREKIINSKAIYKDENQ